MQGPAEQGPPEIAGEQESPEADEERMRDDGCGVEVEEVRQHSAEDRIGRSKQRRKDDEYRCGDDDAEECAAQIAQPVVLRQLAPLNVAEDQLDSADNAREGRGHDAADPVEGVPARDDLALHTG